MFVPSPFCFLISSHIPFLHHKHAACCKRDGREGGGTDGRTEGPGWATAAVLFQLCPTWTRAFQCMSSAGPLVLLSVSNTTLLLLATASNLKSYILSFGHVTGPSFIHSFILFISHQRSSSRQGPFRESPFASAVGVVGVFGEAAALLITSNDYKRPCLTTSSSSTTHSCTVLSPKRGQQQKRQ